MKEPISAEEYYAEVIKSNRCFNDDELLAEIFIDSEPRELRPTHSRILSVVAAETSLTEFFQKMYLTIAKNSRYEWDPLLTLGKLPDHRNVIQPLGFIAKASQVPSR